MAIKYIVGVIALLLNLFALAVMVKMEGEITNNTDRGSSMLLITIFFMSALASTILLMGV